MVLLYYSQRKSNQNYREYKSVRAHLTECQHNVWIMFTLVLYLVGFSWEGGRGLFLNIDTHIFSSVLGSTVAPGDQTVNQLLKR